MSPANDLLSRLQAATGPSRELDAEIALASGWTIIPRVGFQLHDWWRNPNGEICPHPLRYTDSIEAALTLVPEGHEWLIEFFEGKYLAECDPPDHYNERVSAHAPAIALLIAIERAKEALREDLRSKP